MNEDLRWWNDKWKTLEWTFAKTMKDMPHWYIVKGRTEGITADEYERAERIVREYGIPQKFYNSTNIYLVDETGQWKWWVFANPGRGEVILNMAPADQYFGTQNALSTESGIRTMYDDIATEYDDMYLDQQSQYENEWVRKLITRHFGAYAPRTLDVGCGTGLLLDLGVTAPGLYTGIDISQGMLNQLVLKHNKVRNLAPARAEDKLPELTGKRYELVTSLFGSPTYMDASCYERMLELSSSLLVLMTYQEGTAPHLYSGKERERVLEYSANAARALRELAHKRGGELLQVGHFDVYVMRNG